MKLSRMHASLRSCTAALAVLLFSAGPAADRVHADEQWHCHGSPWLQSQIDCLYGYCELGGGLDGASETLALRGAPTAWLVADAGHELGDGYPTYFEPVALRGEGFERELLLDTASSGGEDRAASYGRWDFHCGELDACDEQYLNFYLQWLKSERDGDFARMDHIPLTADGLPRNRVRLDDWLLRRLHISDTAAAARRLGSESCQGLNDLRHAWVQSARQALAGLNQPADRTGLADEPHCYGCLAGQFEPLDEECDAVLELADRLDRFGRLLQDVSRRLSAMAHQQADRRGAPSGWRQSRLDDHDAR